MTLHLMGKAYGRSPSSWFSELDESEAFTLDFMALQEGSQAERRQIEAQQRKAAHYRRR